MYYVIAKKADGKWFLRFSSKDILVAQKLKMRFESSMYLLEINECRIVEEKEIHNFNQIGWENDIEV